MLEHRQVKGIQASVNRLFERIKKLVLGDGAAGLPAIYSASAEALGTEPSDETLAALKTITASYLDAQKEAAKASMVQAATSSAAADLGGAEFDLESSLRQTADKIIGNVQTVIDTQLQSTKNMASFEGMLKIAESQGIDDPTIFFVITRDNVCCGECKRLHMLPDGVTPRVWKMSEMGSGYHKKGDAAPKIGGLHPRCRCLLGSVPPGYGFDPSGFLTYIGAGHDEYAKQRGLAKSLNVMDGVSKPEAQKLAPYTGIDLNEIDWREWVQGIEHEREHSNVVGDNSLDIALIAAAHLKEDPDYYRKLRSIEKPHEH